MRFTSFWRLLLGSISLLVLGSCGLHKDVTYQAVQSIQLKKVDGQSLNISGEALMHNPKGVRAKLLDMNCDLYLDGKLMGKIKHTERIRVPKRSDFLLPFECSIPWSQLVGNGWSLLGALVANQAVEVEMRGEARVRSVFVRQKIPIDHKEKSKLFDTMK